MPRVDAIWGRLADTARHRPRPAGRGGARSGRWATPARTGRTPHGRPAPGVGCLPRAPPRETPSRCGTLGSTPARPRASHPSPAVRRRRRSARHGSRSAGTRHRRRSARHGSPRRGRSARRPRSGRVSARRSRRRSSGSRRSTAGPRTRLPGWGAPRRRSPAMPNPPGARPAGPVAIVGPMDRWTSYRPVTRLPGRAAVAAGSAFVRRRAVRAARRSTRAACWRRSPGWSARPASPQRRASSAG